jgi:hypothetical protein
MTQDGNREGKVIFNFEKVMRPQIFRKRELRAIEEAQAWLEPPSRPELFQQTGCLYYAIPHDERPKWAFKHTVSLVSRKRACRAADSAVD